MRSTGEVMGIDYDFASSYAKAQIAAGQKLPKTGARGGGGGRRAEAAGREKQGCVQPAPLPPASPAFPRH
jgi:hypothetical protein